MNEQINETPPPGFRAPGDDPDTYSLLLPFDTDDREFARGFEAGMLWRDLDVLAAGKTLTTSLHDDNALMLERVAHARGCSYRLLDARPGWLDVEFTKVRAS